MLTESKLKEKMDALGILLQKMEERRAEFEESTRTLADDIENLKTELKTEFLLRKESLTSDILVAKYRKGAVRWDTTGLRSYAKDHPELEKFQKTGEPTIAFCLRKEDEEERETEGGK